MQLTNGAERAGGNSRQLQGCSNCGTVLETPSTSNLRDIYEFGVFTGLGLRAWLETLPLFNVSTHGGQVFGFDSFSGMPEENNASLIRPMHRDDPQWHQGGLNAASTMKESTWPRLRERVVRNTRSDPRRIELVPGFYNESLRDGRALAKRLGMRPALLLDIDCDLYSSSKQALSFMLEAQLLVPGTFVY